MSYLIAAVSTNMWQRQRDGDKSKRSPKQLRLSISDDEGLKQDSIRSETEQTITAEPPGKSALRDAQNSNSQKIKKPHTISDITANMLFSTTLLKPD
ncbi:hypothetical protein MNBD_ALPHA11-303 [hydrothermal vent metagenome]|uniref:Uncharacterized protein n=1 Tax=hydrothermal vent metagenome TaxID=652676 RepID=A0A3B0U803_9ZZZZ